MHGQQNIKLTGDSKYMHYLEGKGTIKFDGEKEIQPYTGCTYLGIKVDQLGIIQQK
jgi:hypothetical protein